MKYASVNWPRTRFHRFHTSIFKFGSGRRTRRGRQRRRRGAEEEGARGEREQRERLDAMTSSQA